MASRLDISIDGQGVYFAAAESKRGTSWIAAHVYHEPWQNNHGHIAIDGASMAQDIAEGALAAGLAVAVNGYHYRAGGLRGKAVR